MKALEENLIYFANALQLFLDGISLFCVLLGLLFTGQFILSQSRRERKSPSFLDNIRLTVGRWLSLALEFQLGSDIVSTTVAPSFEALGRLGAIALIRTFLNYFLTKELEQEVERSHKHESAASTSIFK